MTLPIDNTRDEDEATAWNAFVLMTGYVIAACGPLLVGYLRDATGSYRASLTLLCGVAGVMLALAFTLKPRRQPGA